MSNSLEERLSQLEAEVGQMRDREAIRDVIHRYCRGADRCDLELFKSCYWPDATDCHGFYNGNAHDFCEFVIPLLKQVTGSMHSITNTLIDLDGDRAFVESQVDVYHQIPLDDGQFIFQNGHCRYIDVFEKREEKWKIRHRTITMDNSYEDVRPNLDILPPLPQPAAAVRAPDDLAYKGYGILDVPIVPVDGLDLWTDARQRHGQKG